MAADRYWPKASAVKYCGMNTKMRRKSERQSVRKTKASPEKKIEKLKRTRTSKRRKESSSSENESGNEGPSQGSTVNTMEQAEKKSPTKQQVPITDQDQVWQVKAAEGSKDTGEIQKLKICLTRPALTPERVEARSPHSKRKSSRTTSSSDTASVDLVEEKRKTRHRFRRFDKDLDEESEQEPMTEKTHTELSQIESIAGNDVPMSTTSGNIKENEQVIVIEVSTSSNENDIQDVEISESKVSESVTTFNLPSSDKCDGSQSETVETADLPPETNVFHEKSQNVTQLPVQETRVETTSYSLIPQDLESEQNLISSNKSETKEIVAVKEEIRKLEKDKHGDKRDECDNEKNEHKNDKYEKEEDGTEHKKRECGIEEIEHENTTDEHGQNAEHKYKLDESEDVVQITISPEKEEYIETKQEQSIMDIKNDHNSSESDNKKPHAVPEIVSADLETVAGSEQNFKQNDKINLNNLNESNIYFHGIEEDKKHNETTCAKVKEAEKTATSSMKKIERSFSQESNNQNGQSGLPVMSRKRRWGARPTKINTQKSVSISTDVLKDIIPDVKPAEFDEIIEEKKHHKRIESVEKIERPILPKIVIDNTEHLEQKKDRFEIEKENYMVREALPLASRKISIIKDNESIITRPPSPPKHKTSNVLYITNLVRPFTLPQLKNLLQRTGKIVEEGFWIDKIKSKCYVKYETEDQAIETRHALHGVTWPVSNPKTLQVDFSTEEAFEKAKENETSNVQASTTPGTVEDWLRELDLKRERGEPEEARPWEKRNAVREWDMGKGVLDKHRERDRVDRERGRRDERAPDKRRHRTPERSPEPAKKFKKKEEEAPAKMLDDLFRKTKTAPCIYWLPLSAETIAIKEEQRRQHMAEHERRMQELRHARPPRRH